MVRLDLTVLRYLSSDDFRVLTAIELGMRNHEVVPVNLIESIAKLKRGNVFKILTNLLKHKLIQHFNNKYDGYSLNYFGYDYLALHSLIKKNILVGVGAKIGVGKESDIYFCYINPNCCLNNLQEENGEGNQIVSKDKFCQSNAIKEELFDEKDDFNFKIKENYPLVDIILEEQLKKEFKNQKSNNINKELNEKKDEKELKQNDENNFGGDDDNENEDEEDIVDEKKEGEDDDSEDDDDEKMELALDFSKIDHDIISKTGLKVAILKLARLGRTSFRSIKKKRDYVKNKSQYNWLYLSRISATNEYKFLSGLHKNNFPVPRPIDSNRHAIIMDYIPSFPLSCLSNLTDKEKAYNDLINIIVSLANHGLVHGDFNEFNILVDDNQNMYMIDFPQVVSIDHEEAEINFNRDVKCIHDYFWKKFCVDFEGKPDFNKDIKRIGYLDVELNAYGSKKIKFKKEKKKKEKKSKDDDIEKENSEHEEEDELEENDKDFENIDDEFLNLQNKIKEVDLKSKKEGGYTVSQSQIKDNTVKIIKKDMKNYSKSNNRFKNKKKEKLKFNAFDS